MFHLTTIEPATYRILLDLFDAAFIKDKFALAGGTSLALQLGHRNSIDLDFFSPEPILTDELEKEITEYKTGGIKINGKSKRMLFAIVDDVKCDFVNEPAPLLKEFIKMEQCLLYSIEDIAAMKLHTIWAGAKKKIFLMFMRSCNFLHGTNY